MITFPEISMWGLYPWGGWGATMLPDRFARLFGQLNGKAQGCFLYSEGIYEDVNKAIESQFYLLGINDVDETLRRYAAYELGCPDPEAFVRLAHMIEKTHTDVASSGACDLDDSDAALALAEKIDASLPAWGRGLLALAHRAHPRPCGRAPLPHRRPKAGGGDRRGQRARPPLGRLGEMAG